MRKTIQLLMAFCFLSLTAFASDVVRFPAGQTPRLIRSAHTPDFANDPDAVINPAGLADLLSRNVPPRYWKRVGNDVAEMTAGEKTSYDAAELAARAAADLTAADEAADRLEARIEAIVTALVITINKRLGAGAVNTKITKAEIIAEIKAAIRNPL